MLTEVVWSHISLRHVLNNGDILNVQTMPSASFLATLIPKLTTASIIVSICVACGSNYVGRAISVSDTYESSAPMCNALVCKI